jgi:CheY-like chemotaxis protein
MQAGQSKRFFLQVMPTVPVLDREQAAPLAVSASTLQPSGPPDARTRLAGADGLQPLAAAAGDSLPPILVADDDEDDTFFIRRLIKKTGVANPIRTFDDGSEVVNFLGTARLASPAGRPHYPRLLFLDLKMRGLGGFGFLEWARQQKNLGPLTIVVLSSSNEAEIVQKALELGAHRYLVKYPSLQTINTIVRSVYPQKVF